MESECSKQSNYNPEQDCRGKMLKVNKDLHNNRNYAQYHTVCITRA